MRDKAKRQLIPTIGGKDWICIVFSPWGMVHNAYYVQGEHKAQIERRITRGEI